jgi:uncharacterized protein (DUF427 family)
MWKFTGRHRPDFAVLPQEGQESVWDYPRPPAVVVDDRLVTVWFKGVEIASTTKAVRVLETASPPTFYLPRSAVRMEDLQEASGSSFCEWKGRATYWSVVIPGHPPLPKVAWSYEQPFQQFAAIKGYLSFYPSRVDCFVGGTRVRPQPGAFYGGWVTPEVVGPFKGEPGSQSW